MGTNTQEYSEYVLTTSLQYAIIQATTKETADYQLVLRPSEQEKS